MRCLIHLLRLPGMHNIMHTGIACIRLHHRQLSAIEGQNCSGKGGVVVYGSDRLFSGTFSLTVHFVPARCCFFTPPWRWVSVSAGL